MNRKGLIMIVGTIIICLFLVAAVLILGAAKYGHIIAIIDVAANALWITLAAIFIKEK